MMAEGKDKFELTLDKIQDDATRKNLSQLQEKIQAHITMSPLEKMGNSITGGWSQNTQLNFQELIGAAYAKRMSKDIIMQHISGKKNEKLSLLGKLGEKISDRFADAFLKQKDSYDSVLANMTEVVKLQFKAELDELQRTIQVSDNKAVQEDAEHEHDDEIDYDDLEGGDKYADSKEFTFNVPMGLPVAGLTAKSITSHQWHRKSPKKGASSDHKWVDFGVKVNTALIAPGDGKVITVADQPDGAGKYIEVDHGEYITRYFHLNEQDVKVGDIVKKWQKLGLTGNTGNSTGAHLHYEIRNKNEIAFQGKKWGGKFKVENPEKFMDFDNDGKVIALNSDEVENIAA